jgi:hypothetical protein
MQMQPPMQMQQQTPLTQVQGGGFYNSPVPGNAPPTIVVDTSPQAMQQSGYEAPMSIQMQPMNMQPMHMQPMQMQPMQMQPMQMQPMNMQPMSMQPMQMQPMQMQMQQGGSTGRGPTNRRHTTPRARASSPRGPTTIEGYSANAKVTIQKLG